MKITSTVAAFLLVTVVGCGKSESGSKKSANSEALSGKNDEQSSKVVSAGDIALKVKRPVELKADLSNVDEYLAALNTREISLDVDGKSYDDYILECQYGSRDQKKNVRLDHSFSRNSLDINLQGERGNSNNVECSVMSPDRTLLAKKSFKIMRDIIIPEGYSTMEAHGLKPGENKVGTLFLSPRSKLLNAGINYKIDASELVALKGSTIETFQEAELNSAADTIGQGGGEIRINTEKNFGELKVFMRGKNSGNSSAEIRESERFNPNAGEFDCPTGLSGTYNFTITPSNPRMGPSQVQLRSGQTNKFFSTETPAGLAGGNTGSFYLKSNTSNLKVKLEKLPGKGGLGPKNYNVPMVTVNLIELDPRKAAPRGFQKIDKCRMLLQNASSGSRGGSFVTGPVGPSGAEAPSCISIVDTNELDCM